jgi:hypothetical protein
LMASPPICSETLGAMRRRSNGASVVGVAEAEGAEICEELDMRMFRESFASGSGGLTRPLGG